MALKKRSKFVEEDSVFAECDRDGTLIHLSKSLIQLSNLEPARQLYITGFNTGGRPEGLWFAQGSDWLEKIKMLNSKQYPLCCNLYEITIADDAKILKISNQEELESFDKEFKSYWLNWDYYQFITTDYETGKPLDCPRRYNLALNNLIKPRPGSSFYDVLLAANLMFENAEDALGYCEFYRTCGFPIEKFKFKDWNEVAKKYQGFQFLNWDINNKQQMFYFWVQTLDISSGCIWDPAAIAGMKLKYKKAENLWEKQ